jgi:hypothetical protein
MRPTKILENADKLMEQARNLYENYKPIIKPVDRAMAEDRMTLLVAISTIIAKIRRK